MLPQQTDLPALGYTAKLHTRPPCDVHAPVWPTPKKFLPGYVAATMAVHAELAAPYWQLPARPGPIKRPYGLMRCWRRSCAQSRAWHRPGRPWLTLKTPQTLPRPTIWLASANSLGYHSMQRRQGPTHCVASGGGLASSSKIPSPYQLGSDFHSS